MANSKLKKWFVLPLVLVVIICAGAFFWFQIEESEKTVSIASGNGRIVATEIDIATKYPGRVAEILCHEGGFLAEDQVVARMDTQSLQAQLRQGKASVEQVRYGSGLTSELDVEQAKYSLQETRSQMPPLKVGIQQAENRLAVLLGQKPGTLKSELIEPAPVPVTPIEVAAGVPAEALRRRPDVPKAEASRSRNSQGGCCYSRIVSHVLSDGFDWS